MSVTEEQKEFCQVDGLFPLWNNSHNLHYKSPR